MSATPKTLFEKTWEQLNGLIQIRHDNAEMMQRYPRKRRLHLYGKHLAVFPVNVSTA